MNLQNEILKNILKICLLIGSLYFIINICMALDLLKRKRILKTYHPLFDKYKVDLALQGHNHVYERTHPITVNADDNDATILQDYHPVIYKNPHEPIFVTVGTGELMIMI